MKRYQAPARSTSTNARAPSAPTILWPLVLVCVSEVFGCASILGLESGERSAGDSGAAGGGRSDRDASAEAAPDGRAGGGGGRADVDGDEVVSADSGALDGRPDALEVPDAITVRDGGGACPVGMVPYSGATYRMLERGDEVTVDPGCVDRGEATIAEYRACVKASKCTLAAFDVAKGCSYDRVGRTGHPINCLDTKQAEDYCAAQGKRLPTEEEWEWVARGGASAAKYPWGDNAPRGQLCWSGVITRTSTCKVGSFAAGDAPGGVHDLAGNVAEWTSSPVVGSDPPQRVFRGGSYTADLPVTVSAAHRGRLVPDEHPNWMGVRCFASR